ncbi:MAG: hypothetical protein JOZ96_01315 [Acidobacteria bacterium]|nr:hypothetical protein [Acidobacteriota bacterium]MBV9923650.1 hypothetical protein [Acidobacteriota bacterium]
MTALLFILAVACPQHAAPAKRTAAHDGVSLTFDEALAREVKAETAPAAPLEGADEKPDGVYPEHVAFTLVELKGAPADSFNEPVIRVCPVAAYLKAFSVSPAYVRDARRTLEELRGLIRRRPVALKGNVPALPFADGTEVFHARVKYLRFSGGAGVAFLTQAQQDDELLNSQHVSYSFRGLTDDGRFYVTADLPVGSQSLAATRDTPSHEGYSLLNRPGDRREARRYAAYVERVRLKLERLSPEQFSPGLNLYDDLLSSLEIRK